MQQSYLKENKTIEGISNINKCTTIIHIKTCWLIFNQWETNFNEKHSYENLSSNGIKKFWDNVQIFAGRLAVIKNDYENGIYLFIFNIL